MTLVNVITAVPTNVARRHFSARESQLVASIFPPLSWPASREFHAPRGRGAVRRGRSAPGRAGAKRHTGADGAAAIESRMSAWRRRCAERCYRRCATASLDES